MALKLWRKAGEQFLDNDGDPLTAGTLTYYAAGTTDLIDVYMDDEAVAAHTNPVDLNSAGLLENPVYIDDGADFKEVISDDSSPLVTQDDYTVNALSGATPETFSLPKRTVVEVGDDLTLTTTHRGYTLNVDAGSSSRVISLDEVGDWANGHNVIIRHAAGTADITVTPAGDDTINGDSSYTIEPGDQWAVIVSKGDEWVADKKIEASITAGNGLTGNGTTATPIAVDVAGLKTYVEGDETASENMQGMVRPLVAGPDVILTGIRSQVDGGEASTAATNVKRYLDTEDHDRDDVVTLADSVFTVARTGDCIIKWSAPGYQCGTHQANLYDDTNAEIYEGSTEVCGDGSGVSNRSEGVVKLTLAGETDFYINHKASVTSADGFGVSPYTDNGLFTRVEIYFL